MSLPVACGDTEFELNPVVENEAKVLSVWVELGDT